MTKPIKHETIRNVEIAKRLLSVSRANDGVAVTAAAASGGVDPEGQKILDVIHSFPSVKGLEPQYVRDMRKARGNPLDYERPDNVTVEEVVIPSADGPIGAELYRPITIQDPLAPALIYYHGGGFVLGDVPAYRNFLMQLAEQAGVVVVSVEYRLAPEYPFPKPLEDVQSSYLWLAENAAELKIDSARMAIGGDSAGANLSTVTCMYNRDQGLAMPVLQLLIYPTTIGNNSSESRKKFEEGLLLTKDTLVWFHDHYIPREDADDPRFNVLAADDHSNIPPAFVLTGGFDPLRDEGVAYAEKLRSQGVPVRHSCYTDMFHGFINYGVLAQAQNAVAECAAVLSVCFKEPLPS